MNGTELSRCLDLVGWSIGDLAGHLGCTLAKARTWLWDGTPIPDDVATWMQRLAQAHALNPASAGPWRVKSPRGHAAK